MVAPQFQAMLCCPRCQGDLIENAKEGHSNDPLNGELRCKACEATYPTHFGFPVLMPRESLTGEEWVQWEEHLRKFQARREARIKDPDETINRLAERSQPQPEFAKFTGIEQGTVLDIGCGPGKFRNHFDPARVTYVGLDPLTLPDVIDFPFVQGIAEYLPFRSDTFTDVVVLAALDHFRDIDRFIDETRRVLGPGGRLHIQQSVHEVRGPISAVKVLGHWVKDTLEDWRTGAYDRSVPKHLEEFTSHSLVERLRGRFDLVARGQYSATWYSPLKLFLTFAPCHTGPMASEKKTQRAEPVSGAAVM